jgi:hypothetical protein
MIYSLVKYYGYVCTIFEDVQLLGGTDTIPFRSMLRLLQTFLNTSQCCFIIYIIIFAMHEHIAILLYIIFSPHCNT